MSNPITPSDATLNPLKRARTEENDNNSNSASAVEANNNNVIPADEPINDEILTANPSSYVVPSLSAYPHRESNISVLQYMHRSIWLKFQEKLRLLANTNNQLNNEQNKNKQVLFKEQTILTHWKQLQQSLLSLLPNELTDSMQTDNNGNLQSNLLQLLLSENKQNNTDISSELAQQTQWTVELFQSLLKQAENNQFLLNNTINNTNLANLNKNESELIILREKYANLELQLTDSTEQIKNFHRKIDRLQLNNEKIKDEYENKLVQAQNTINSSVSSTNNASSDAKSAPTSSESANSPSSADFDKIKAELEAKKKEISELNDELTLSKMNTERLDKEIEVLSSEKGKLANRIYDLQGKLAHPSENLFNSTPFYRNYRENLDGLQQNNAKLSQTVENLRGEVAELQQSNARDVEKLTKQKLDNIKRFKAAEEELNNRISALNKEISGLKEANSASSSSSAANSAQETLTLLENKGKLISEFEILLKAQQENIIKLSTENNYYKGGERERDSRYLFAQLAAARRLLQQNGINWPGAELKTPQNVDSAELLQLNSALTEELDSLAANYSELQLGNSRLLASAAENQRLLSKLQEDKMKSVQLINLLRSEAQEHKNSAEKHTEHHAKLNILYQNKQEELKQATILNNKSGERLKLLDSHLIQLENKLLSAEKQEKSALTNAEDYKKQLELSKGEFSEKISTITKLETQLSKESLRCEELKGKFELAMKKLEREKQENRAAGRADSSTKLTNAGAGGGGNSGLKDELDSLKQRLKCSVCSKRDKSVVITKCFHLFCSECIDSRLKARMRK
jgi:E3 ubiquitin-protein ligase BRE1